MVTTARWRALRWFADHAVDINSVMGRRMPSTKMRRLMIRDGQLKGEQIAFDGKRFTLTESGQALLARKGKRNVETSRARGVSVLRSAGVDPSRSPALADAGGPIRHD